MAGNSGRTQRVAFIPGPGLLPIIEKFQEAEFCRDRSEAINRLLGHSAKEWLAKQAASSRTAS